MKLFRLNFYFLLVISLSACASKNWVSGHRIIGTGKTHLLADGQGKKTFVRIALTNISDNTICGAKASVIGIGHKPEIENIQIGNLPDTKKYWKSWKPGEIWLLSPPVEFDCRIPLKVKLEYMHTKTKLLAKRRTIEQARTIICPVEPNQKPAGYVVRKEVVELPKQPTAIRLDILEAKCT